MVVVEASHSIQDTSLFAMVQARRIDLFKQHRLGSMLGSGGRGPTRQETRSRRKVTMLVLSRKPGEQIRIGSHITLAILDVRWNQVRIGLSAPAHIRIARAELLDRLPQRVSIQPGGMQRATGNS